MRAVKNPFTLIAIAVMLIVFVVNEIVSWNGGPFRIMVWGGGRLADSLGVWYETVFEKFQLYRLLTYGYVQTAVWHLLANGFTLWRRRQVSGKENRHWDFSFLFTTLASWRQALSFFCFIQTASITVLHRLCFPASAFWTHWLVRDKALWRAYRTQKGFVYCVLFFVFIKFFGVGFPCDSLFGDLPQAFFLVFLCGKTENRQNRWRRL